MTRSIVVAYLNFPIEGIMSCIKGKGYGFLFIFLFNPRKSEMNRIILFFLGIAREGHAHSEGFIGNNTPSSTNLATSFFIVAFSECGIRKGLTQKGFSPSFISKETGDPVHLLLFPWKAWIFARSTDKSRLLSCKVRCFCSLATVSISNLV